jgi:hypothetical protein
LQPWRTKLTAKTSGEKARELHFMGYLIEIFTISPQIGYEGVDFNIKLSFFIRFLENPFVYADLLSIRWGK